MPLEKQPNQHKSNGSTQVHEIKPSKLGHSRQWNPIPALLQDFNVRGKKPKNHTRADKPKNQKPKKPKPKKSRTSAQKKKKIDANTPKINHAHAYTQADQSRKSEDEKRTPQIRRR
jgi:hypothetical protein